MLDRWLSYIVTISGMGIGSGGLSIGRLRQVVIL